MHKPEDVASLDSLMGGLAVEKFNLELMRVVENCLDLNTGDGDREVTLKVKVKPNKERTCLSTKVSCTSRLQGDVAAETQLYIGRDPILGVVAVEHNPQQMRFEYGEQHKNVSEFKTRIGGDK